MTLLNKKSKNHFLGLKQIATNSKASLYIDSDLDSITCDIGPEEIEELVGGEYILTDTIGNIRKTSTHLRPSNNFITPGGILTHEFSKCVLGFILDFNLVFEYHDDTTVSDILSLFDPSIREHVKTAKVLDPCISKCASEEEIVVAISTQSALLGKGFGRKFIEKQDIRRRNVLPDPNDYHSYQFITFVKFPDVHYLKKYNQHYIKTTDVDFHGVEFCFGELDTHGTYKFYDSKYDFGISSVTDVIFFKNNIYTNVKATSSYSDSEQIKKYKELVKLILNNTNFVICKEDSSYGQVKDLKSLQFDHKVSISTSNSANIIIEMLNNFKYIITSGFNPRASYSVKNIEKATLSLHDIVNNSFISYPRKYSVNLKKEQKGAKKLNLLASVSSDAGKVFRDNYNLVNLKLPLVSENSRSAIYNWFSSFVYDTKKADTAVTGNLLSFYNKLLSGGFNDNYITFTGVPGISDKVRKLNQVGSSGFPYYDLVDYIADVCLISIFTDVNCRKELYDIGKKMVYRHIESTIGDQTSLLYSKSGLPQTLRAIQYSNLQHLIKTSTKGDQIKEIIEKCDKSKFNSLQENIYKISSDNNLGVEFVLDNNYFKNSSSIPLDFREDKVVFNGSDDIFDKAFKAAFYGHKDGYGVTSILGISESQLKNPGTSLKNLFIAVVSTVSTILAKVLLHPNAINPRTFYGAPNSYLESIQNLDNILDNTKIKSTEFKSIGDYLNIKTKSTAANIFCDIPGFDRPVNIDNNTLPFGRDKFTINVDTLSTDILQNCSYSSSVFYKTGINTKSKRDLPSRFSTAMLGNKLWLDAFHLLIVTSK